MKQISQPGPPMERYGELSYEITRDLIADRVRESMPFCERCGNHSPDGFRFCGACGARLPTADAPHETRKVVTVLFSDATGWTALGENLDPEALRAVMSRYFKEIRATIERHGGTVEKFIGDAVMAVFGIPWLHEDDALRAVRAAAEIRERLPSVAEAVGMAVRFRTGVNTGMVFTGEGESLVVGDAVNLAARLEQAAAPSEILLGAETYNLVRHAVAAEPVEPLSVKGKAEPVSAYRLLSVLEDTTVNRPRRPRPVPSTLAAGDRLATPMIGREVEMTSARALFEHAAQEREPQLLSVVGEAGIGKSRLALELVDELAVDALVLVGRCLSYGEGTGFWPLREALTQAAGGESRDAIRGLLAHVEDADLAADVISATLGLSAEEPVSEQVCWAFQRLLEAPRKQVAVLVVIEDAHWAEDPLLDLLECLVDRLTAPVLVLCLARPELLDRRRSWKGERARFSAITLGPLRAEDARDLLRAESGGRPLSVRDSAAILEAAEGNPLFVEQLLAMRADEGWVQREHEIPVSIQSLLAARLDRLSPGERALIERGAVIGREFPPAAVIELLPAASRAAAAEQLRALSRRRLIQPVQTTVAGEQQLSFRHILIWEVAYHSTAKALRGELHEHFADWLAQSADGYDEFVGSHLERAFRYRTELGHAGREVVALAARAGEHLAAVGRRALARGDAGTAASLLRRADEMLAATSQRRADLQLELARALIEHGTYDEARGLLRAALGQAQEAGAAAMAARVAIEVSYLDALVDPSISVQQTEAVAEQAIAVFKPAGDDEGLARAWFHLADVYWTRGLFAEMERVLEQALTHAERAGTRRERSRILSYLACVAVVGPWPVDEGLRRCEAILEHAVEDVRLSAFTGTMLAVLEAMQGSFDQARNRWRQSKRRLEDTGLDVSASMLTMYGAYIELLAGHPETGEPELRDALARLERAGEQSRLATIAALLGRVLCAEGRYGEAADYLDLSERAASADDVVSEVLWRGTRARLLAQSGETQEAQDVADRAVALAAKTDFLMLHADALSDRAEALWAIGRAPESAASLRQAIDLYERKGMTIRAEEARVLCQEWGQDSTAPTAA